MLIRAKEYIVVVYRSWGKSISGPVLAVVGLVLLALPLTITDTPSATKALRWGAWFTLGLATIMILVAQYDAWSVERDKFEAERLKNELELARNHKRHWLATALRTLHPKPSQNVILCCHAAFPQGHDIASYLASVLVEAGWRVDGTVHLTTKPNSNGIWVCRSTAATRANTIAILVSHGFDAHEENVVRMDGEDRPLEITVCAEPFLAGAEAI